MSKQINNASGYFDKAENIKKLLRALYLICAGLLLLDFVHHRHVLHSLEQLWGFYAIFGFLACVVLVLLAKQMRKVLMRDNHYYDTD